MSDGLPTQARALADNYMNIRLGERHPETAELLRELADLCDTYREALEWYADPAHRDSYEVEYANEADADNGERARVALATGEQARVVEAEEGQ